MPLIDRNDSVLVVIDVQDGFYPETRTDVDRPVFDRFVDRVAWVVGVAGSLDVPVVVTEENTARNGGTAERVRARLPGDAPILDKAVFAAPDNPEIDRTINGYGVNTVVLVGMETDVCVAHSALRFKEEGKRVVAVGDALFSPSEAHQHGIRRLEQAGVEIVSAKELYYDWVRSVADAVDFVTTNPDLAQPPDFSL